MTKQYWVEFRFQDPVKHARLLDTWYYTSIERVEIRAKNPKEAIRAAKVCLQLKYPEAIKIISLRVERV